MPISAAKIGDAGFVPGVSAIKRPEGEREPLPKDSRSPPGIPDLSGEHGLLAHSRSERRAANFIGTRDRLPRITFNGRFPEMVTGERFRGAICASAEPRFLRRLLPGSYCQPDDLQRCFGGFAGRLEHRCCRQRESRTRLPESLRSCKLIGWRFSVEAGGRTRMHFAAVGGLAG